MVHGRTPPAETGGNIRETISTNGDGCWRRRFGSALLVLRRLRNHGQLQHGYALPLTELRHQHIASIRKFDRIMVTMRNIGVYRTEFPDPEVDGSRPDPSVVVFDVLGERQFGPWKHADRHGGLAL
jgi:hypothetical protein